MSLRIEILGPVHWPTVLSEVDGRALTYGGSSIPNAQAISSVK